VDRKDLDRQTREEFNRFQEGCVEENTNTERTPREPDAAPETGRHCSCLASEIFHLLPFCSEHMYILAAVLMRLELRAQMLFRSTNPRSRSN